MGEMSEEKVLFQWTDEVGDAAEFVLYEGDYAFRHYGDSTTTVLIEGPDLRALYEAIGKALGLYPEPTPEVTPVPGFRLERGDVVHYRWARGETTEIRLRQRDYLYALLSAHNAAKEEG